jgi:DNA-binding GntR family transcriptional regulator
MERSVAQRVSAGYSSRRSPPASTPVRTPVDQSVQLIVQSLEEDIVLGKLHPRERLIEDDLMVRFEAKRHVVRQALSELDRMGLAERPPNRSVAVKDLDPTEVEQIYAMRTLLETAAANQMPLPIDPDLLEQLVDAQTRHDTAASRRDVRALFRINIEFHRLLFSQCGNPHLAETIDLFGKKAHAVRSISITRPEQIESAGADHWQMIDALRTGDRSKLVSLLVAHISVAKTAYIEAYHARFPNHPSGR